MECSGYCARTSGCSAMFYNEESLDCELGSKRPGANVIKLFLTLIYKFRSKPERSVDLAGKACKEETLKFNTKTKKLWIKLFFILQQRALGLTL
jgi:hypothetical protein